MGHGSRVFDMRKRPGSSVRRVILRLCHSARASIGSDGSSLRSGTDLAKL
jgi:hypothetical protein